MCNRMGRCFIMYTMYLNKGRNFFFGERNKRRKFYAEHKPKGVLKT